MLLVLIVNYASVKLIKVHGLHSCSTTNLKIVFRFLNGFINQVKNNNFECQ